VDQVIHFIKTLVFNSSHI